MEKSDLEKWALPKVEDRYNMTSTSQQYPGYHTSGPVSAIADPKFNQSAARPYFQYDTRAPIFDPNPRQDLIGHIHQESALNKVFFSESNIDNLQTKIQDQVSAMSGGKYKIDKQNPDDLMLIMRSYYLMFGQNNDSKVAEDLEDLNRRVVGYAAAKIYSEVDFYQFYIKDIETFAPPIANPTNVHVYGSRTGELKSFF
jgi:hypothetical protein